MEKANIPHSRLSTYSLREIISDDEYTLVNLTDELIEFNLGGYDRMRQILICQALRLPIVIILTTVRYIGLYLFRQELYAMTLILEKLS